MQKEVIKLYTNLSMIDKEEEKPKQNAKLISGQSSQTNFETP